MAPRHVARHPTEAENAVETRESASVVPFPAPEAEPFGELEERVIALARHDGIGSLQPPGWFDRAIAALFGVGARGRRLADARLEVLRRAVVVARHRHHLPDAHAAELRAAGFTPRQVRAIERRTVTG